MENLGALPLLLLLSFSRCLPFAASLRPIALSSSLGWLLSSLHVLLLLPAAARADLNEYRLLRHLLANYDNSARKFFLLNFQ